MEFPYLCLLVTGGHTQIWEVHLPGDYILHSNTVDDAAGEAFDKGARILGLDYPGGPAIEKIAVDGECNKYQFTIPVVKNDPFNFSFSGLKTALLYKYKMMNASEQKANIHNLAASYQETILISLFTQLIRVVNKTDIKRVSIVGGVAANKRFRTLAQSLELKNKLKIFFPPMEYCTDNAAMIATAGYEKLKKGLTSSLTLKANPSLALNDSVEL
jgi:N6-L-threonylcarbamoyladenine synthase